MGYECANCNETFPTLTRKRLHDCPTPAGPEEWIDEDVSDLDDDAITDKLVEGLLTCIHCDQEVVDDFYGEIRPVQSAAGLGIVAEFDCPYCGGHQRNEAEVQ